MANNWVPYLSALIAVQICLASAGSSSSNKTIYPMADACQAKLESQMSIELQAVAAYTIMSSRSGSDELGLTGLASLLREMAKEELDHAMTLKEAAEQKGTSIISVQIPQVSVDCNDVSCILSQGIETELKAVESLRSLSWTASHGCGDPNLAQLANKMIGDCAKSIHTLEVLKRLAGPCSGGSGSCGGVDQRAQDIADEMEKESKADSCGDLVSSSL